MTESVDDIYSGMARIILENRKILDTSDIFRTAMRSGIRLDEELNFFYGIDPKNGLREFSPDKLGRFPEEIGLVVEAISESRFDRQKLAYEKVRAAYAMQRCLEGDKVEIDKKEATTSLIEWGRFYQAAAMVQDSIDDIIYGNSD